MSNEEARHIVQFGLDRRKEERQMAEREARLEKYEQEQIQFCNEHCADARMKRDAERATRRTIEQAEIRRKARAEALEKAKVREDAAMTSIRYYGMACLGSFWLTTFTRLPVWAAATLALGLAVFPAAYIFRLYFPAEQ